MMGLLHLILVSTFLSVSMTSESFHAMEDEALVVKCPQNCQNRTIKWYITQTNQLIPAEEGGRIHSSGRFLWFLPTSKEDAGNYTCVTRYSNYTKQSTVSVMVYPHKQGICFPSRIRYPNDTGTLTSGRIVCPTIDNYAKATIVKWYKDCKPLQGPREKYSMGEKYLFIKRPQKTDEGHYTCHFTYIHSGNVYNVSATRPFIVKEEVSSPISPQIQYPTDNTVIQVEFGSPVNISCGALLGIGKPNIAVVTWEVNEIKAEYLNTSRFREDHHFFMRSDREYYGESTLTIEEVTEEDLLSNFTCVALNEIENVVLTVTLQLKVPCKGPLPLSVRRLDLLCLVKETVGGETPASIVADVGRCVVNEAGDCRRKKKSVIVNSATKFLCDISDLDGNKKPRPRSPNDQIQYFPYSPCWSSFWIWDCITTVLIRAPRWANRKCNSKVRGAFSCLPGDNHSTYITIGVLVLLVIIALLLILYQFFRIDIVLLCQGIFKPYKTQDDGKIYDAYVIYPKNRTNEANFVEYFVHQILPDVLENKHGYKLCIYGRDMLPGEDAANALEIRIQKSRRLIIILTPQLIQCEEFGYEHQIALYNALIQNNIKVILLEMETIGNYEGLQESLRYIIKQQGTIKWKEKYKECPHASNSKFWKLVRYHMPLRHKPLQLNYAV